jgi:hypothetical protein
VTAILGYGASSTFSSTPLATKAIMGFEVLLSGVRSASGSGGADASTPLSDEPLNDRFVRDALHS